MKGSVIQYQRAVRKGLHCSGVARRRLEKKLTWLLESFLEENPSPDQTALEAAFGTPEALAATLLEELSPEEHSQWRWQKLMVRVVLAGLVMLLAVFSIYTFFQKMKPAEITIYEYSYSNEEFDISDSSVSANNTQE